MSLILASASPRRREILSLITTDFSVLVTDTDETLPSGLPVGGQIAEISRRKAEAAAKKCKADDIILSADTAVIIDNTVLGKPKDREEARKMLKMLSGRTHSVITAFTVLKGEKQITKINESFVTFNTLSEKEIENYVNTGEPLDKAGAYAVQGKSAVFISRIEGDFFSVMGLPVSMVYETLKQFDF